MTERHIITLLSDFGDRDVYVGVMKGVIAGINPQLQVIDLTHQIPPQNIAAARFCLMSAWEYFPPQTVHVAIVDPGVGSQRRAIAVEFAGGYLVAPDNGLSSGILSLSPAIAAVELTNPQYWRSPQPSTTFHGRDIFASVGAYLASGVALENLGDRIDIDSLVEFSLAPPQLTSAGITGTIQYVDRFGNLVSNIPAEMVAEKNWQVQVKDATIPQGRTYSDVAVGEIVALIGSHGWLEIAVNGGDGRSRLGIDIGDTITAID